MRKTIVIAAVALAGLGASPAWAAFLDPYFGASGGCFVRHYEPAHLASHPEQTVTDIHLGSPSATGAGGEFVLDLGFTLRSSSRYAAQAYCSDKACSVEGDGGSFTLEANEDGLRLAVGEFLALEGVADFSHNLATSDDRVFLLYPAKKKACL